MKKLIALLAIAMPVAAQQSYSPYVDRDYPENVYWGDTHLHSYLSGDAYSFGATITPDQAYRFAKGEITRADGGEDVRIRRPLDFLMVADHATNLGVLPALVAGDPRILSAKGAPEMAERLAARPTVSELLASATKDEYDAGGKLIGAAKAIAFLDYGIDESFKRDVWQGCCRSRRTAQRSRYIHNVRRVRIHSHPTAPQCAFFWRTSRHSENSPLLKSGQSRIPRTCGRISPAIRR